MATELDESRAPLKLIEAQTYFYQKGVSLAGTVSFAVGMFTLLSLIALAPLAACERVVTARLPTPATSNRRRR